MTPIEVEAGGTERATFDLPQSQVATIEADSVERAAIEAPATLTITLEA